MSDPHDDAVSSDGNETLDSPTTEAANAAEAAACSAARAAAEAWLPAIDGGDAATAWREAATLFRDAVAVEDWSASLARVQGSVGRPVERRFESADYRTELPGAPDGHYVILTYATSFEHKRNGTETVVPMRDDDGAWRVSGYFVK